MFNIGTGELALILVFALLVLGPTRLPELARGLGKVLREFRRQTDEVRGVVEREFYRMDQELDEGMPKLRPHDESVARVPASSSPELVQGAPQGPAAPETPAPAPADESDPGHPDYHRPEPATAAAPDAPPAPGPTEPKA